MLGSVSPACHDALAESRTAGVKEWHGEFRSRKAREKFAVDLNDPQHAALYIDHHRPL